MDAIDATRDRFRPRTNNSLTKNAGGVDPFKEIGSTLEVVEETQLLTKLAKTGLLSKAERAGVKLADLEPLLLHVHRRLTTDAVGIQRVVQASSVTDDFQRSEILNMLQGKNPFGDYSGQSGEIVGMLKVAARLDGPVFFSVTDAVQTTCLGWNKLRKLFRSSNNCPF
mgnify:CR=1 FL=1